MNKNKMMIHGVKCSRQISLDGIYGEDDGFLYMEVDGVEIPLSKIMESFRDNVVKITITSAEEVMV